MPGDASRGPKPYRQVSMSTIFLRVPTVEWPAIKRGIKREFRTGLGHNKTPKLWDVKTPTPVVAYTVSQRGVYDQQLMVLEAAWQEPLGAISPESLAAEGFATLAEFRRHWMRRERKRFPATRQVFVCRLRPWAPDDRQRLGPMLLDRLYGAFLPDAQQRAEALEQAMHDGAFV